MKALLAMALAAFALGLAHGSAAAQPKKQFKKSCMEICQAHHGEREPKRLFDLHEQV